MNRKQKLKLTKRYLQKRGTIRFEQILLPKKRYQYYRKGGYTLTFIDDILNASINVIANNKYNAYKEVVNIIKEMEKEGT